MELIADILMTAGAFGAGVYCYVLASRLKKFTRLETGMGGAIAVLSAQVDDMTRALEAARSSATGSVASLSGLAERAEAAARRLELLMASMHDLPTPAAPIQPTMPHTGQPMMQLAGYADGQAPLHPLGQASLHAPQEPAVEDDDDDEKKLRFVRRRSSREFAQAAE